MQYYSNWRIEKAGLLELEGTWEEVAARSSELAGRRVRLTVLPESDDPVEKDGSDLTIEEKIIQLAAQIPDGEWDQLPADLSDNLDHYVYGIPKK
jgi:hypothetical protein